MHTRRTAALGRYTLTPEPNTCDCSALSAAPETFEVSADPETSSITWSGVIGIEGQLTGDGRLIENNALRWDGLLPAPLLHAPQNLGAHAGAQVVGRILTLERKSDGKIWATGDLDSGSEIGLEAARQIGEGLTPGVSMDLDDISFEIRVAGELFDEMEEMLSEIGEEEEEEVEEGEPAERERETDDDGRVIVAKFKPDDEIMVTTSARVRAATLVSIPAFAEARITLGEGVNIPTAPSSVDVSLVAGAAPMKPPAAWFADPKFSEVTPLTITDDGRIFGHLAVWDTCHTGFTGQCVSPPRSHSGYAYFRRGVVVTSEGDQIPVGSITMDTLHAPTDAKPLKAAAHYEHTGTQAALVTAGEDSFGIWVAGTVEPSLTDDQLRRLRSSPLSGDWRTVGGHLELLGALAVNVPGFPVPRPQGLVASGQMQSLVAGGMVPPSRVIAPGQPGALSTDDLRYLKRLIAREKNHERDTLAMKAQALAARVQQAKIKAVARTLGLTK